MLLLITEMLSKQLFFYQTCLSKIIWDIFNITMNFEMYKPYPYISGQDSRLGSNRIKFFLLSVMVVTKMIRKI